MEDFCWTNNNDEAISVALLASAASWEKIFAIRPIKKWFLFHFWEPFKGISENNLLAFVGSLTKT